MATRKYEQRVRAEQAGETQRRILDAVGERLRAAPSRPVSLDQVARDAKVSRSTIYLVFGSRAGLFDAVAEDLWTQAGFGRLVDAVQHHDAREHLRGALRAGVEVFARMRDVARALFSMAALDQEAIGGAIGRIEEDRAGGNAHLARRLADQGLLRDDVTLDDATDVLWTMSSFDTFDLLWTGRGRSTEDVVRILLTTVERTLLT